MTLWSLACSTLGLTYLAPNSPIFSSEAYGGWNCNSVRYVDIVTGCLFLIDRNLWDELGGFNPAFFMYGEEADLCHRARKLGARPIVTPRATIIHYGGASTVSTVKQQLLLLKGKATLLSRHWRPVSRRLGRALFLLGIIIRWWAYRLASLVVSRRNLKATAAKWRMMWQRRREWIDGYDPANNS